MNTLGAGIIGLGIGEQHIAGYRRPPACDVAVLCDFSEEKLRCVAKKYPKCRRTTRWEELLDDDHVNVVSIASFDDAHFEQTVASLKAGMHCFVEKPLCRSIDELLTIKETIRDSGDLQLASNLVLRAAPVYRWLRAAIQNDELGEVYAFDGDYLFGRIHKITGSWRKDIDNYSVMQGGAIHLIDLMLWLTDQKPETVTTQGNRVCTRGTEFRQHDFVSATYSFESGLIGRITANFGCVHPHQHVVRVFGTKATFLYDDQGPRLQNSRDPAKPARHLDLPTLPTNKSDLIPDFIDGIINATDRDVGIQKEFDTISVCLAADEALDKNEAKGITYV